MSRVLNNDFENLKSFLEGYSIKANCDEMDFYAFVSELHKKYYSYLVLMEEYRRLVDDSRLTPILSKKQFNYLQESVSDCGQCFFLSMNGCYKGAKLLLRSSIETFIRSISIDEVPDIETETSVYEVFKLIDSVTVFSANKKLKDSIHNDYKILCEDVHTAGTKHMAGVTALNYFPRYSKKEGRSIAKIWNRLLPCYITILTLKYNCQFHSIEYPNKEVILHEIINDYKAIVHGRGR